MNLKNMTLYAILGYTYFFVLRTAGTLSPVAHYSYTWTIIKLVLNFFAYLGLTLFFIYLMKEYIKDDEFSFLNSTALAFLSSLAILLIDALNNFSSLLAYPLDHSIPGLYMVNMISWIHGFIIVIFFFNFAHYLCKNKLCKTAVWGLAGAVVAFILRSVNMLNYFYLTTKGAIFLDLGKQSMIIPGAILVIFGYLSIIYFFINFYKILSKNKVKVR